MPNIRLETSRTMAQAADLPRMFDALHKMLVDKAGATIGACKSRVVLFDSCTIADGAAGQDMAHLEIRLLAGRTPEVKAAVGEAALALLTQAFAAAPGTRNLSVQLVDMDPKAYFKTVL